MSNIDPTMISPVEEVRLPLLDDLSKEISRVALLNSDDRIALVGAAIDGMHVVIQGPPSTAKTTIAKGLAAAMGGEVQRISGTPDILPPDIIGNRIYVPHKQEFDFEEGVIFANVVVADEINRMSPKSQSALLEAMQENAVTVGRTTYPLPQPFMVVATHNEFEIGQGVYPLTKANKDRFAIGLDFPPLTSKELLDIQKQYHGKDAKPVANPVQLLQTRANIKADMSVEPGMLEFASKIIGNLIANDLVDKKESVLGGYRPFDFMVRLSIMHALDKGRKIVTPDDIAFTAPYVLSHRTALKFTATAQRHTTTELIDDAVTKARHELPKTKRK